VSIPGIGERLVSVIISEIGVDMRFFLSPGHLAAWCGLAPANRESAGKRKPAGTRQGNPPLASALVEAAWAATRISTRLSAKYRRLVRRFGGPRNPRSYKRAVVALAHTLCEIVWCVLHDEVLYTDLGFDFYSRRFAPPNPERRKDQLVAELAGLGYRATVEPLNAWSLAYSTWRTRLRRVLSPARRDPSFVSELHDPQVPCSLHILGRPPPVPSVKPGQPRNTPGPWSPTWRRELRRR
jgi:Transposase IS116/IS110/IS902 family